MKTLRRAVPLAVVATLAIGLAGCSNDGPDTSEPTEPAVSMSIPQEFTADAPAWDMISDLPAGEAVSTALSPDGKYYAYAQLDEAANKFTVGQINLESGERVKEASIDALTKDPADDTDGRISLIYSGSRLVATHAGTDPGGKGQWSAALFEIGKGTDPAVLSESVTDGERVKLPTDSSGPMVVTSSGNKDKTAYFINTETLKVSKDALGSSETFEGCGDKNNCDLPLSPVVQSGDTTVATFKEGHFGGRSVCSSKLTDTDPDPDSGFDGCLSGFMTSEWSSQDPDVAPKGAIPESAYLYASGDGYLVGAWKGEEGGSVYRTININDPRASHPLATCEEPSEGTASHTLRRSPNQQYVVAGALLFDVQSGEGHCFRDDGDVTFSSVDSSGTAWGANDSSWTPSRYASSAVSATPDGEVKSEGDGVAIPMSFMPGSDVQVGTFAVTNDALDGATVVGAYPLGQ